MTQLHTLVPTENKKKRVGRGGSRGGTSGRGHKGQRARSGGNARPGFEGGQMPLYRRLPKRGFTNARHQEERVIVSLKRISEVFDDGQEINQQLLIDHGIIKAGKSKGPVAVKVLADGALDKKFIILAHAFSESAKKAIEGAGGEARVIQER